VGSNDCDTDHHDDQTARYHGEAESGSASGRDGRVGATEAVDAS
jgi:hypothetical protein